MIIKRTLVVLFCVLVLQMGLNAEKVKNGKSNTADVTIFGKVYQTTECWAIKLNCVVYTFSPVSGMNPGQYYLVKGKEVRSNSCKEGQKIRIKSYSSTIALKCLGTIYNPNHLYLDGDTMEGPVRLAPETGGGYSGTHWQTEALSDGSLALKCLEAISYPNYLYLDGLTVSGDVRLAPETGGFYSGTHWQVEGLCDGSLALRCLGAIYNPSHLYLDGLTVSGDVRLAPETGGFYSGTHWQIVEIIE